MTYPNREVAVIITAKDAAETAAVSIRSALAQDLATEVIFVDDGSRDGTEEVARACDDGTGRLKVLRLPVNRGPSYGRNLAIDSSTAPYFCILDADDFLSEGRLGRMFEAGGDGWDLLADDLIFCREMSEASAFDRLFPETLTTPCDMSLPMFVQGNLPHLNRRRRELGFLKPLVRRATAERLGIRYDERLRLGEDLVSYAGFLLNGAVFRLVGACGYHAVQHATSLSALHRTQDLAALYQALLELRASDPADELAPYVRVVRNNLAMREALDSKRSGGWGAFLSTLGARPDCVPHILSTIVRDKLAAVAQG